MKEEMKRCPMTKTPCIKNECAWWEESFEGCALTVMSGAMAFVAGEMMERMEEEQIE